MPRYYYITPVDYELAKQNGIAEYIVRQRVFEAGWNIERAITTKVQKKKNYTDEEKELMKLNGITVKIVTDRIRNGWDREKALNTPKLPVLYNNYKNRRRVFSKEVIKKAKDNGICYNTFRDRVKRMGWSLEDAANIKPQQARN